MDIETREEIQVTNGVAFSGIPICLTYFLIFVSTGYYSYALMFLAGLPIFSFPLYSKKWMSNDYSKIVLAVLAPIFWLIITIALGRECGFYLGFMVISFPALLFFKEIKKGVPYVAWSVLCMFGSIFGLMIVNEPSTVTFAMLLYLFNLSVVLMTIIGMLVFFRSQIAAGRASLKQKNREVMDSINYAAKIQEAVLPEPQERKSLFSESFVFYQPKDVVSGDFYWFGEVNGKNIAAVVDCTGHGVPGALMSMLGNSFLNEIILEQKETDPGSILTALRSRIVSTLSYNKKDGMDMSIIVWDKEERTVRFAGAKNPIYQVSKEGLTEFKGDKMPVGVGVRMEEDFNTKDVSVTEGDMLYLFTDGFPDQFGGPNGKKYKYGKFKKFLQSIASNEMNDQRDMLETELSDWSGALEQIDDVCIVGIRV